jgi:putative transposase
MADYDDIRTGRHRLFSPHVQLVSATKYRHQVFAARHLEPMEEIMREVCADFGAELREFNGEPEHVHLLVNIPPTIAISRLVNSFKGVSSRRLRQEFPDLRRHYWRAKRLWSGSYFARSARAYPCPAPIH